MSLSKYSSTRVLSLLVIIIFCLGLAACNTNQADTSASQGLRTQLLVRAPDGPLPAGRALTVKSRTEDAHNGISHVELYAVELPTGETNVLIRADEAPFRQTAFTASQQFTPLLPGHYVIKVVGYNNIGEQKESEYISFDVQ